MAQTICLNMIVKDESRVIRRCLDSVAAFVDCWLIVDTGSTDGTQDMVRAAMKDLTGELVERPWRDFAHNRNEALELARDRADYIMVIDADEVLRALPGFSMPLLTAGAYRTLHQLGENGVSYYRTQIVRGDLGWRYIGAVHEYIDCDADHETERLEGLVVKSFSDGARNANPREKYDNDAAILERALEDDPDNARHVFYLAQSYRDAGQLEKSLEAYRRRVAIGGWAEEVWYALFQIAVLRERLGEGLDSLQRAFLEAYRYRPQRAEPLCRLARICREKDEHALAFVFANAAMAIPRPEDILFLDGSVYDWRALDEYAIACHWIGRHGDSADVCRRLLDEGKLPPNERERIIRNINFSLRALGESEYRA